MSNINTKLLKVMLKLGQNKWIFCLAWNVEIYLFILFCHMALLNVSVSLFYTLVFFCNIQFGLLVDTY